MWERLGISWKSCSASCKGHAKTRPPSRACWGKLQVCLSMDSMHASTTLWPCRPRSATHLSCCQLSTVVCVQLCPSPSNLAFRDAMTAPASAPAVHVPASCLAFALDSDISLSCRVLDPLPVRPTVKESHLPTFGTAGNQAKRARRTPAKPPPADAPPGTAKRWTHCSGRLCLCLLLCMAAILHLMSPIALH